MKISLKECRQSVLSSSQPIPPAPTNRARVLLKSIVGRGMGRGGLDLVMRWMIKIVCGLNIVFLHKYVFRAREFQVVWSPGHYELFCAQ